ncbi:MAG TPA: amidohydrolase family protein [Pirellulales bacterium]|jgi:predicted TIM-barrel fold metal-dependent hydrolase|nr:amidohydrolase family protein [Pirellulales bacterium]
MPAKQTRRGFLGCSLAAATATLSTQPASAEVPESPLPPIIDAHVHFYDPTRPEGVPWPNKNDPVLFRKTLPADFRRAAGPAVQGTIVVEASPWLEDNQWLLDLADRETLIVGIVGHLEPATPSFAGQLERFAKHRLFRGIRVNGKRLASADPSSLANDLKRLADHDLELDVNGGPDMLPTVLSVARRFPWLRVVVNHLANTPIDGKAPPREWQNGMAAVGACPNVFCKVSALVEKVQPRAAAVPESVDYYRPVLDVAWNAFGADRLIYGSNWPVSRRFATYPTVQRIAVEYFRQRGADALKKFLSLNAAKAYKWVPRPT